MNAPTRVAVAGGSGFIGRHVVAALMQAGHAVRVLARGVEPGNDREGLEHLAIDVGAGPLPAAALRGCEAVVNLVGIKAPRGDNDFSRAHVCAVEHLIAACREAGIDRFVHISVAQAKDADGPYAQTKRDGEQRARDSGLAVTVLRPGLVYGVGDEPLRNLVQMVALATVVPLPRGADGPLPAIDVLDVAAAVVATLQRPQTAGMSLDLVGPEVLTLRGLVRRVAEALELPTVIPPVPDRLVRPAAALMERMLADPPLSRSQLQMLTRGLPGDPEPARQCLDLHPRALTDERIREIATTVPALAPSLRLVTSAEHRHWLHERASSLRGWPWLLGLALLLMLVAPWVLPSVWTRMAIVEGALLVVVLATLRPGLRGLLRPSAATVGLGLGVAALAYLGGDLFVAALRSWAPAAAAQVQQVYGWSELAPLGLRLVLLPLIVLGEDVVWRGALTLPLAARIGPALGSVAAGSVFAVAHLTSGPPLLVAAALIMGTLWSALAIRSRSLVPVLVSHLVWDLLVMFVRPL
ncbi:MAG: NAD(P)H-binding protein [Nannocystaceae bacterium]